MAMIIDCEDAEDLEIRRQCKFETPPLCPRAKSSEWLFNDGPRASTHSPHPLPPVISLDPVEEYWTLVAKLSRISIIEGSTDIPPSLPPFGKVPFISKLAMLR